MVKATEKRQRKRYVPKKNVRVDFYYPVKTKVEFEQDEKSTEEHSKHQGMSKNFSTHGMCFNSDVCLNRGEHLNLEVYIPLREEPICMEGRVCWSDEEQKDSFDTGVEILSVEGKNVDDTVYHDEVYDVDWSEVLESVLGQFRILAQKEREKNDAQK